MSKLMRFCQVAGCERPHFAADFCGPHYKRKWRHGDPLAGRALLDQGDLARMARHYTVDPSGCWLWTSKLDWTGYGRVQWRGKGHRAHRVMYQLLRGPIPEGLEPDHLCRVKRCVNPDHLELVTHAENLRRHYAPLVAACPHGHVYDEANTFMDHGKRRCRECMREQQRRRRARKKLS